jgi:Raf kinase inhibitor-like YbhB/YbcL family protein
MQRIDASAALLVALLLAIGVAGCAHDGRELSTPTRPAPPLVTTTTAPAAQVGSAAGVLTVSSPAFAEGAAIPALYTCDGAETSPPIEITGSPTGTAELALSVVDPDANGHVHWVVSGLSPALRSLAEATVPEGAVEGRASDGTLGWRGPCPPAGSVHHYVFTVYAIPANGAPSCIRPSTIEQLRACAGSTASFTAIYQRQ